MNKIAKKILVFTTLLTLSTNIVGCGDLGGDFGGGVDVGEMDKGFWAQLAETAGGNSTGGGLVNTEGDVVINGDPTAAVAYDGSPVTITFYHTMGKMLRDVLDAWIPVFNEMYPNITIEHGTQGDYDGLRDMISTELNAGNSPHIAYCYPDHVALYNSAKAVATLDDYIASTATVTKKDGSTEQMGFTQAQANEFVRGYYEEGRAFGDGKMYTLPYSKSTEVLYYNKTFFEKHNLTVPTTWDEMETLLEKIAEIDPKCVPLGYDSEANWFITMCEQLGTPYTSAKKGEKFLFNVETNHTFVERLKKWYQLGWLMTKETSGGSYTSDLFTETDPEKQKIYMCIGSSAGASYQCPDPTTDETGAVAYPFEAGVAMIPQIDAAKPKVISQGPSLCMFKKQSKQEMAATWLFMKFLTTNVGLQANFSSASGYAPVLKDLGSKLQAYQDFIDTADGNANLQASCVKQCLAQESALFVSPAFNGSSGARDQVGLLMQSCFLNSAADGQTTIDFVKAEFNKVIAKLEYDYGK